MKRILIVDDNSHLTWYLEKKFREAGHDVYIASTGVAAIKTLSDCTPDIVFIDYFLPGMNGDKLCQIIRKMEHLKNVYLVIMSAAATELHLDLSTMGANALIAKGTFQETAKHLFSFVTDSEISCSDEQEYGMLGLDAVHPRQLTMELLAKYRHLQTMLDSISEGIIEIYCEQIVYANPTAVTILGKSQDELLTAYLPCLFDETGRSKVESVMKSGCNGNSTISWKGPIQLDDRILSLKKLPFQGDADTIILLITDITERVRAEDALRDYQNHLEVLVQERTADLKHANEKLQQVQKMEAIGIIAGGVAHDLNNVLGVIIGYAEMVLNDVSESSVNRPRLVNIMKGGERAAAIVQDLLTMARRGVPTTRVLNLNSIITDCRQSPDFEKLSDDHPSVQINIDLEQDLLNISGSSVHLGKTLFNLTLNACEAMPNGGILTIKTANQYLDKPIQGYDEIREGEHVVLFVSDTGEGIAATDLKHIFEPFYTKKVMGRSGTGLGLAVVWGTVKDHQGYLNVQSEEGKGSIFTLYFPVTREAITAEHISVSLSEYLGNGESILVVDDVREQRDLAVEMLRLLNYRVASVACGEDAVAYMKEHEVDLLVLDMIMDPGMDGLDTYRSILEIHPKQRAIIVSGFSESDRVLAAKGLGMGAYVRKPYIKEKLGLAVKKELDRSA